MGSGSVPQSGVRKQSLGVMQNFKTQTKKISRVLTILYLGAHF